MDEMRLRKKERKKEREKQRIREVGGSHGLVVMGGDSCSEGRGFESHHSMLDGPFVTYICCKIVYVCLKRQK